MGNANIDVAAQYWVDEMLENGLASYNSKVADFKLFLTARIIIEIKNKGYCSLEVDDEPNLLFKELLDVFGLPKTVLPKYTYMRVTLNNIKLNGEEFHPYKNHR